VQFRGSVIHFRCRTCLEYFAEDSERFLKDGADHNPCGDTVDRRPRRHKVKR